MGLGVYRNNLKTFGTLTHPNDHVVIENVQTNCTYTCERERDFSFLKDHLARKDLNCHHEMRLLKSVLNDRGSTIQNFY